MLSAFCLSMVTTSLYDLVPGIIACSSKELSFKEIISDYCLVFFFDSERVDLVEPTGKCSCTDPDFLVSFAF